MNYLKRFNINFYKSTMWKRKRKEILERDNFECQMCKSAGAYSKAMVVHHIKHYKDYPELGLKDDNLISLCGVCHNKVHPEKSFKNKKLIHEEKWE